MFCVVLTELSRHRNLQPWNFEDHNTSMAFCTAAWMKTVFIVIVGIVVLLLLRNIIFAKVTEPQCRCEVVSQPIVHKREEISKQIKHQLEVVAVELSKAASFTVQARRHTRTSLRLVLEMIQRLGITKPDVKKVTVTGTRVAEDQKGALFDVCPKVYISDQKISYPTQENNRVLVDCKNARPFPDVLYVLLNGFDYANADAILAVLREIYASYPKLTVHVAVHEKLTIPNDLTLNVLQHLLATKAATNDIWNTLVDKATTDFVLVGRRIERFLWHANIELERLVRVVSELGVDAAGGASRTPDGHWSLGCQQTRLGFYKLTYLAGYYRLSKSCAFCGYLTSPFVSKLSMLRAVKFRMASPDVVFHDYFIRLKKLGKLAMSCPDVMLYMQANNISELTRHKQWIQMAQSQALNVVQFAEGKQLSFSCSEAKTTCGWRKGISVPICCMNILIKQIQDLFDICDKLGIFCRANCGTVLGAVKFNGVLPWELDADISYTPIKEVNFWERQEEFIKLGYTIYKQFPGKCPKFDQNNARCLQFAVRTREWKIDVWDNTPKNITNWLRDHQLKPTKVQIGGRWFNSLNNPGLYVRNHFGFKILKHVEHPVMTGVSISKNLPSGRFIKCPHPGSINCLDQYDPDGNIDIIYN